MSQPCYVCLRDLATSTHRWEYPNGDIVLLCLPCYQRTLQCMLECDAYEREHQTTLSDRRRDCAEEEAVSDQRESSEAGSTGETMSHPPR